MTPNPAFGHLGVPHLTLFVDANLRRAMAMAAEAGLQLQFHFAHTWGHSRRTPKELEYLRPHLRPHTALPGESRRDGW